MLKKTANHTLIALSAVLLALGGAALTFFPAPRYSRAEKRMLAEFPRVSVEGIVNGSVARQSDSYATERVPFRSLCRHVWGGAQLALLQGESHGVLLCRDGSLSARTEINEDVLSRNLSALSRVRRSLEDIPITLAVAPTRIQARSEVLPASLRVQDASALLPSDAVTFPDCNTDEAWYRTDHHWTTKGAYLAYVRLGEALGYTPLSRDAFSEETVCEDFFGTSAARAGLPFLSPDRITLWRYEDDCSYTVTRNGTPAAFKGLYDTSQIEAGDPYAVFLGGNCGILEINKGETDTRPTLLLIRDSFAAPVLPFLARHFRIIAVDPRYDPPSLSALCKRADSTLVLCGMQTIGGEPFLARLLKK